MHGNLRVTTKRAGPNHCMNADAACGIGFVGVLLVLTHGFPFSFSSAGIAGYAHR